MRLDWSSKARADLVRLYEFLRPHDAAAARRTVQALVKAPTKLLQFPRIGELVPKFAPREVRRFLIRDYEFHYEIINSTIFILRVWHTRERR